jgi:sugar lactone lactonase YvrE
MRKLVLGTIFAGAVAGAASAGEPTVINAEARFPEGPLWLNDKLYYVEYGGQTVRVWDGSADTVLWEQEGCGPSAVVQAADRSFLITCYDAGTIVRIEADGSTVATYDKDADGNPFVGPNDFAPDRKGGVYFSASGPWESEPIVGQIYYLSAKGTIRVVADDLHYANGLALSPNGATLYAAESEGYRIIHFQVGPDGSLSDRRLFARLNDLVPDAAPGMYPDGIEVDAAGNLWIGQYSNGQILQVSAEAKLLRTIEVPSAAAPNLVLGADEKVLYVTAVDDTANAPWLGKVYAVPLE